MYRIYSNKLHPRLDNQKMRRLFEDYKKKTRFNSVMHTMKTISILSQQKKREIGTLKNCLFYFFGIL